MSAEMRTGLIAGVIVLVFSTIVVLLFATGPSRQSIDVEKIAKEIHNRRVGVLVFNEKGHVMLNDFERWYLSKVEPLRIWSAICEERPDVAEKMGQDSYIAQIPIEDISKGQFIDLIQKTIALGTIREQLLRQKNRW